ncbi:MAG: FkbM family methyltransferase [Eubacteriales bacterium]
MDLWQYLSKTDKVIVMYGMGNGADKILAVCEKYGITVSDFFASNGFVRGQSFHGKTVLSFSDIKNKYGAESIIVLVSFASSLPGVIENIERVSRECETYIPDVPVRGDTLFCNEFYSANKQDIDQAYSLLADERSKEVFKGILDFRRFGKLEYLKRTEDDRDEVMGELLHLDEYKTAVDVGAYDGDTARELLALCPLIERIYAFEPDRRNFRKLKAFAEKESKVIPINAAAWNANTTLVFDDSGNRNSGLDQGMSKRHAEVCAVALDSVIADGVDYIKYDVEGAEKEALDGSIEIIKKYKPDLLISLYHRTEDMHELILKVHEICPDYKLYMRRYRYVPAWDLNLYATIR